MKLVRPTSEERPTPRGIIGGSEISQATTGATNIFMGRFQVPAGAQSRPHYHANCESALYMLSGSIEIRWGDHLEDTLVVEPGDLLYVPPRETHIVVNLLGDGAGGVRGGAGLADGGLGRGPVGERSVNAQPL